MHQETLITLQSPQHMATVKMRRSVSPEAAPSRALRAPCPDVGRSLSACSFMPHGSSSSSSSSSSTDAAVSRQSLLHPGSISRHSSASYSLSRQHDDDDDASASSRKPSFNIDGTGKPLPPRRRGFMRPQGTDFAASARARESVMSLGSIAHLQYYFARTGLLDGKGAQLARKKHPNATLDLSALEGTGPLATCLVSDADSTYASMDSSPEMSSRVFGADDVTESPVDASNHHHDNQDDEDDDFEDSFISEPDVLPPTVSTYHQKKHEVPRPPTMLELQADLEASLRDMRNALEELQARQAGTYVEPPDAPQYTNMPDVNTQAWYELQGMRILDVVTLAIRAAKMYYSAHELPDRLDSIKSEKQIRADLLGVMEVLKQMATRTFKGGMKDDEVKIMLGWVESVLDILKKDGEIEAAEQIERLGWSWLSGDWTGRELERERHFLLSMDPEAEPLPEWTKASADDVPTPFLESMRNGLRLVKLHNAAVKKSRRRFGAIPTFHVDTQKPYRSADNLRYWAKAAELRFEVLLSVDPLGIVYNSSPQVWLDFEAAIVKWCRHVREEIANELA